MALEDMIRYQGGELASRFYGSDQDRVYVNGALYQLASDLGIEKEAKGFIDGSMASEDGIKTAVGVYSTKYREAINEVKMGDLFEHYDEFLKDYLDVEEVDKVKAEFGKFSNETYGEINKEIAKSLYVIDGTDKKLYDFSDKEKEKAKDVLEEYQKIFSLMKILEDIKFENLRPKAVKRSQGRNLKNLVGKL
jgi:hypothetical protein